MADVIDIRKRLADKVRARFSSSDEDMKEKYSRLQNLVSQTDTIDDVLGLLEECIIIHPTVCGQLQQTIGGANPADAESLAGIYFEALLCAGKMAATCEAIKLLTDRLAEMEPEILDEHFLTILDKLKDTE